MKRTLLALTLCSLTGCAYLDSDTSTPVFAPGTTNVIGFATTHARSTTFFDANASLAKFRNSNGGPTNTYTAGTVATGINESSSASNVVAIINAAAGAAAKIP